MTGNGIDLDRRFRLISSDEAKQPNLLFDARYGGSLAWKDLLGMRRVVILAEAGSGKSYEFTERWRELTEAGALACHATVQDVARSGLEGALGPKDIARYNAWRANEVAPCWLFIDSVDEAKDEGLSFATALRHLATAVSGREERTHILISGRFSDWDFEGDRAALEEWLAIPGEPPAFKEEDHRDLIRATLSHRQPTKRPEPEDNVHVMLMTALDEARVRRFVLNAGVTDADAFIAAVEHGNLWRFASRPLDLEWMASYWHAHDALGTLADMLEASINARLLDPKPARQRRDPLSLKVGRHGLERIGAGLHLSGKDTLRLPTEGIASGATASALAIESVLPDWPRDQQLRLLGRPVFDPATLGRVRIHNDNEGAVRAYLTARWLRGRLAANCPPQVVDDLLFADMYGHSLVRPDMVEVSAWLSIWNPAIADKVTERDPYSLLTRGDPGSLPVPVRIKAIEATLCGRSHRDPWFMVGEEMFRRLADPAFDAVIPGWWGSFSNDRDARHLILRLIWRGKQAGGLEAARQAAFDEALDDTSQILAGYALAAVGTDTDRQRLSNHIITHAARLPRHVVLHALSELFPRFVSVDRFFAVIDTIGITDSDGTKSVHPIGSELSPDLASDEDLTSFLKGVVARIGPLAGEGESDESAFTDAFDTTAVIAGLRLLDLHPDVPAVVTHLVLRLREHQFHRGIGPAEDQLKAAIVSSPERRRASFWQAAAALREHPWINGKDEPNVWQLQHLGWPGTLGAIDLDWLIADMEGRNDPRDRLLALGGAHAVWRETKDRKILNRIKRGAATEQELRETLERWLSPPAESPELRQSMARLKKVQRQNRQRTKKRDNSWVEFIDHLRADPTSLDSLRPQTETTVDSRLFHLWQLLSWRTSSRSRFSISDLSMIEPLVGEKVAKRFGEALIAFAEVWTPHLPSEKPKEERNSISSFDTMGLAGISLAAAMRPRWAQGLSDAAADQAARYAVVELNGFPDYMLPLAAAKPAQVAHVLNAEIDEQLATGNPDGHGMLDRITYADQSIASLVAPHLRARLETEGGIPPSMLRKVVDVLIKGISGDEPAIRRLVRDRALNTVEPEATAQHLALLFAIDGDEAVDILRTRMGSYGPADKTTLCTFLLPRLFGDRFRRGELIPFGVSFPKLEELVVMAHDGIRREEDLHRANNNVYSPGQRDHAQDARQALFSRLADTPGEATHAALLRLANRPNFPIERDWLLELARRRAVGDAYLQPWRPEDVVQFETEFDKPPSTTADLQLLAIRRIEQIEHDLRHDKFTQGSTLQALPNENAVQRWLGNRFQAMQRQVYTVDRETHVADEKEPDITLHSRFSGVSLPIEIKVIDKMSVPAMEQALITQLCGRYLRHRTARHGILLFVHQRPRLKGWVLEGHADLVPLQTVLSHLRDKAEAVRTTAPDGPQPIVICIDVSQVPSLTRKSKAARPR